MRRRSIILASSVTVAVIALAGCGSTKSSNSKPQVASAMANQSTSKQAASPAKAASASASTATPPNTLKVSATEMKFTPSSFTAKAGKVTFDFTNAGTVQHELVVLKTNTAPTSLLPGADGKVSEATSVGEVSETDAGKSGTVTLNLKPGKYVLVCNIPGHYKAGMSAPLIVS